MILSILLKNIATFTPNARKSVTDGRTRILGGVQ